MAITAISGTCQYSGCSKRAEVIACGRTTGDKTLDAEQNRHPEPGCFCMDHALIVEAEGYPEYTTNCPNCDCRFGV